MTRVRLLKPVAAVIERLHITGTWAEDPPGAAYSEGYDKINREVVKFADEVTGAVESPLKYMSEIRVPCQLEFPTYEELRQDFGGDAPLTTVVLVFHRRDLERLLLLDRDTKNCLLKKGDRVARVEKLNIPGRIVHQFPNNGIYIYQLEPGSPGFGPDGYDLEIAYMTNRSAHHLGR
jgi:hypothetical protein